MFVIIGPKIQKNYIVPFRKQNIFYSSGKHVKAGICLANSMHNTFQAFLLANVSQLFTTTWKN